MTETFKIHASRIQAFMLLVVYCVVALINFIYIGDLIPKIASTMLCALLCLSEYQRLQNQQVIQLWLNPADHSITLEKSGQSYFYRKYKVYPTRWFAILRLIDKTESRTLFLNSDRFHSVQNYRAMRFSLIQMERVSDVA